MEIKKIGIGIILLIGIYFGYQHYKNQQNVKVDQVENLENVKICSDGNCTANSAMCGESGSLACCSGNCNAGVCEACYKLGGPCNSDGQCCASDCAYGFCGGNLDAEIDAAAGLAAGTVVVGGLAYAGYAGGVGISEISGWLEVNGYTWLADYLYVEEDESEFASEYGSEAAADEATLDADASAASAANPADAATISADSAEVLADADTAVATVTPEAGATVFAAEDAAAMGTGAEIAVDAGVVTAAGSAG